MKHPDIHCKQDSGTWAAAPWQRARHRVAGSTSDLNSLYDSHFAFVWRNLQRLGVSQQRLEDAAQEVFLVAHRRWRSFDAERSTAQTWLFGIVLHVANNERRAGRRRNARMAPASAPEFWTASPPRLRARLSCSSSVKPPSSSSSSSSRCPSKAGRSW